ncbi:outer membrane beta-barrel protein [Flavobacterium sp.]|uniref:outer membrane beta-barrel protein n=1 Tax=Flavobacterium sp. TaxID=239 RepID=UPI002603CFAC|nr:outer membrane beta-barrel protein [Flavobacterium sp.]
MKKILLFALLLITTLTTQAQIKFEEGYIIKNGNERITCWIKNLDWRNNPKEIEYKRDENGTVETANWSNIKAFGFTNQKVKFISAWIKLDRSSEKMASLSRSPEPIFNEEGQFLRVLVEGDASLYLFEDENSYKFFYSYNGSEIEPLIFKSYLDENIQIRANEDYKNQILTNLKCESITREILRKLRYRDNDLIDIFEAYNTCKNPSGAASTFKQEIVRKSALHLSARIGLNTTSASFDSNSKNFGEPYVDFGNKMTFRIGAELEYILPLYGNKWSLILEPSFQSYKSEIVQDGFTHSLDYKSLDIPVGVRYYMHLNDKSALFINGIFSYNIDLGSKLVYTVYTQPTEVNVDPVYNFGIGAGFRFLERFSFELRYATNRSLVNNETKYDSKYNTTSFILGYRLF